MSSRLNILLVDNSEQDYATINELLTNIDGWHCHLEQAATYTRALEKIKQAEPDICLLNPHLQPRCIRRRKTPPPVLISCGL